MIIAHHTTQPVQLAIIGAMALFISVAVAIAQENDSTASDSLRRQKAVLTGEQLNLMQLRTVGYTPDWQSISEGFVIAISISRRASSFGDSSDQWFGGTAEYGLHILLPAATDELKGLGLLPFAEGGVEARFGGLYVASRLGLTLVISPMGTIPVAYLHPAAGYSLRIGRRLIVQPELGAYVASNAFITQGAPVYVGVNLSQSLR